MASNQSAAPSWSALFLVVVPAILTAMGAVVLVLQLVSAPVWADLLVVAVAVLAIVVLTLICANAPRRTPAIPPGADFEREDGAKVVLEVPASRKMLEVSNAVARGHYGREAMSLEQVERWCAKNPYGYAVLRSQGGEYLGYFDILPISDEAADALVKDHLGESAIRPEHILAPEAMKDARTLYFASVAVRVHETEEVWGRRQAQLFLALIDYLHTYYGGMNRRALAIAATPEGTNLLRRTLRARKVDYGDCRKDGHDVYEFDVTPESLEEWRGRIHGWHMSPVVSIVRPAG